MKFEDLKLNAGYPLQIQTASVAGQTERYSCRLIGSLPGRSILLSVPKASGRLVRLRPGQKIIIRLMIDNGIGVFASQIETQTFDPYPILHIAYPETVTFKGIRGATRVAVNQPIVITNLTEPSSTEGVIVDISVTGARIELVSPVGKIGDTVELVASVIIQDVERELKVKAIIRSQVETLEDAGNSGLSTSYGVEFIETQEDNRLIMYAFVYSQMAIQENHS
jgi:c-di-GMP-binding flagellar brake protein YcgR